MSCMLRASGAEFDAQAYLADSPFEHPTVYRRGEPIWPGAAPAHSTSGFNVTVSEADLGDLDGQIEEAIEFLDRYEDELRRLGRFAGVQDVEIDFGVEWPERRVSLSTQSEAFPPDLLWRAGALDIALRITHYLAQQQES